MGAFDGQTFRQIWRSAPLGDATNAYLVQLGVAGGRVVATDPLGVLHVLDAASGKEVAHLQLGDRADAICAPREDPRRLWIALKESHHRLPRPRRAPEAGVRAAPRVVPP